MHPFTSRCATAIAAAALAMTACAADDNTPDIGTSHQQLGDPLLEQLQALPGVTVTELAPRQGARQFQLLVTQPVDHAHPDGATFQQRVMVRSRGVDLPTTLASTGYGLFGSTPRDNEISFLLAGNAITVEHRYYEGSVPSPADPRHLTIRQAAADHHRIVQLLRPIFTGAWISTGASKGGMTSIYHRRYYPGDVDATVAYVAPQSYTTNDPRYGLFLDQVGSAACRQRIIDTQRMFLDRRAELLPVFEAQAAEYGFTYDQVGGVELAFEHAVAEFRFALWQYSGEELCAELPAADAPADLVALYLDFVSGPGVLASDQSLVNFGSYYYQAATQLGSYGPRSLERHIRSRLEHPGTYRVERYSPLPITQVDPFSVPEVQLWLATRGERIMLIYGENDPWSAGGFVLGNARDSFHYVVPGGNHGAAISILPEAQRAEALGVLARWAGVQPPAAQAPQALQAAEPEDWSIDRQRRLPL
ncbi:MAG TPA: S28 family serine protease, partial [Kofleriaceae bacterium]|nr:S28 family serine protease [Kofleriaceae bacterium]